MFYSKSRASNCVSSKILSLRVFAIRTAATYKVSSRVDATVKGRLALRQHPEACCVTSCRAPMLSILHPRNRINAPQNSNTTQIATTAVKRTQTERAKIKETCAPDAGSLRCQLKDTNFGMRCVLDMFKQLDDGVRRYEAT